MRMTFLPSLAVMTLFACQAMGQTSVPTQQSHYLIQRLPPVNDSATPPQLSDFPIVGIGDSRCAAVQFVEPIPQPVPMPETLPPATLKPIAVGCSN